MKLFTLAQYDQLMRNGAAQNNGGGDPVPVVKLHLPGASCIWLLTELDPLSPLTAFGLCDLGMGSPELGYVSLAEIVSLKLPFGICVEQDESFVGKYPISVYARAARDCGYITEDEALLNRPYYTPRKPGFSPR